MFPVQSKRLLQHVRQRLPAVAVGIDVGRSVIRVATLLGSPRGIELAGLASAPLSSLQGAAGEVPLLRQTVERACRHASCWPRRPAMAVAAGNVLARALQVPLEVDDEAVSELVERAARQLPVAAADLSVAWAVPGDSAEAPSAGTSSRPVLMVAARREAVLARQSLAARAGLGRVPIEVDLFASLRAAAAAWQDSGVPGAVHLLVDAGLDSVRAVASCGQGQLPSFRVVPAPRSCTTAQLASAVAEALHGLRSPTPAVAQVVILSGGRAGAEGLALAITSLTGLSCCFAEPFAGLADPRALAPMSGPPAAVWSCAIGLARRGLA